MDYETMNWEAEAKRIEIAFGSESICEWEDKYGMKMLGTYYLLDSKYAPVLMSRIRLDAVYTCDKRYFQLGSMGIFASSIEVDWKGQLLECRVREGFGLRFAYPFFHLDLLTSEVETALQVSISNHQKLEWTLEYAQRLNTS